MTTFLTKFFALSNDSSAVVRRVRNSLLRWLYLFVGCVFTGLAIFGAYTPVVPTVPFALVAAWCFERSSPRLHHWLRNLKFVGPMLRDWEDHKQISVKSKKIAITSIVLTFSYSIYSMDTLAPKIFLFCLAIGVSTFILTRKSK